MMADSQQQDRTPAAAAVAAGRPNQQTDLLLLCNICSTDAGPADSWPHAL